MKRERKQYGVRTGPGRRERSARGGRRRAFTGSVLVLALWAMLAVQAGAVSSGTPPYSGTAGEDIRWALDDTGVLVLRGSGEMTDYVGPGRAPWYARRTQITRLRVEDGVTRIGNYSFTDLPNLETVELGKAVTVVGNYAFDNCPFLERLSFGPRVAELGTGAFSRCDCLRELNLPASLEIVGQSAFSNCASLEEVSLPDGVRELKPYAFSDCSRLRRVELPAVLRSIGAGAFADCSALSELSIPGHVSSLGAGVFSGCSALRSVNLPAALDEIPGRAFSGSGLESVRIPDGVTEIGGEAFSGCTALGYAVIGKSVTKIEEGAFQGCWSLREVYYPDTQDRWDGISMDDFRRQLAWQGVKLHLQSSGPEDGDGTGGDSGNGGETGGDSGNTGGTGGDSGTGGETGGNGGNTGETGGDGGGSAGTAYINSVLPDTAGGTVRVEVSGTTGAASVLAAVYAPDGRLLRVRTRRIAAGGTFTFDLPTADAGSVTAFLLDSRSRPMAGQVRRELTGGA